MSISRLSDLTELPEELLPLSVIATTIANTQVCANLQANLFAVLCTVAAIEVDLPWIKREALKALDALKEQQDDIPKE